MKTEIRKKKKREVVNQGYGERCRKREHINTERDREREEIERKHKVR